MKEVEWEPEYPEDESRNRNKGYKARMLALPANDVEIVEEPALTATAGTRE